ncbi:hypothetical protein GCM10008179_26330 [Hansschlegelia plantiphila]|uniref:Uncharacterized protein n=1 Tax=Hansschlegelia plantiphila TaxID=374655 RepID=A0A9W6MWM0_9HYPH|nr:hypothetical protein GCM10008179_26330 [Hansschlegelia plantiphila]
MDIDSPQQARRHLARDRLSLPETIAQSIGTVAPSGTPALVIPGRLRAWHGAISLVTILLLLVPLAGSLYPVPAWPFSALPYVFLGLLALGVSWFLILKARAPEQLQALEADLLGAGEAGGA